MMQRHLKMWDTVGLVMGIIIGVGIYECAPMVAQAVPNGSLVLLLWVTGGMLSLMGALCYAELAATYPHAGGDYVFLTRAYGRPAGFLFGWFQLAVIRPGDIAAMALVFAHHVTALRPDQFPAEESWFWFRLWGISSVMLLTACNLIGVHAGKSLQNVLTVIKVLGIGLILLLAVSAPSGSGRSPAPSGTVELELAMILILFTYGGWNEMAYLAAELEHPERNVLRGLVVSTLAVVAVYAAMNLAFLYVLGHGGLAASNAVAMDAVSHAMPRYGGVAINLLIALSALGAINGLVFTGARISYAVGREHPLFRLLGYWHPTRHTPVRALLLQSVLASGIIVAFGDFVDALVYTAAAVYLFYMLSCLAVIVLRYRDPDVPRPYRVTGYPVTPIAFSLVCIVLIRSAILYRPVHALALLGVLALGCLLYAAQQFRSPTRA